MLKIIGLGFRNWAKDRMNLFDAIIVIISLSQYIIIWVSGDKELFYARSFRVIRLFRSWKLCHYFQTMRRMIKTTWRSLRDIMSFLALLSLFVFVEALLGKELFAYRAILHEDSDDLVYGEDNIVAYL